MKVRRVVTGHNEHGRAVFVSDEEVEPSIVNPNGGGIHRLWGADQPPTFPDDGSPSEQPTLFPPVGGYRFGINVFAPILTEQPPRVGASAARESGLGNKYVRWADAGHDKPGMHASDTIDFLILVSGELVLELDDGVETVIRPGDTVVQNGTWHRWINRGTEPAVLAWFIAGAHRASGS